MIIHIGRIIREKVKENGMSVTKFAEKINYSRRNIYAIFSRESIDTVLLKKIGEVLKHDFFSYYILQPYDNTEETTVNVLKELSATEEYKQQAIKSGEEKITALQNELSNLKEKYELLLKINELLEQKVKV